MEQTVSRDPEAPESGAISDRSYGSARPTVVVMDAGPQAWVSTRDLPGEITVGSRFTFRGASWQVVGYRPHARAFIAEPIAS